MISVVHQNYDVFVESEHVILGNDALLKCKIPSYVTDFVTVLQWVEDSQAAKEAKTINLIQGTKLTSCEHTAQWSFLTILVS